MSLRVVVVVATALVLGARATVLAGGAPGQHDLSTVRQLDCTFTIGATGRWDGARDATARVTTRLMRLRIARIDVGDGSATVTRATGTRTVSARADGSNLFFLDPADPDGLTLTTVFSQEAAPGRLKAVLTRTGAGPAQFYGSCGVQNP